MKTVKLFEIGEEVYIKATVQNIVVENGEIKYNIKDEVTGRDYGYYFTGEQLTQIPNDPVPKVEKNTTPLMKDKR